MIAAFYLLAATALAAVPCRQEGSALPSILLAPVVEGLKKPVHATGAGDGSGRVFIVEQAGVIKVLSNSRLKPFLDIRSRVASGGEKGLLSVAFHPQFKKNGRFFVNYTSPGGGLHTIVSEFKVSAADPQSAVPNSEKVLLKIKQPYANHNGGQVAFGPDGLLYVGMGDGGSGDDPQNNGQRDDSWLGKMLRLNVDSEKPAPEIFAKGLRNPWRFSFDPITKRLWAGDVGQNNWEEIDIVEKGKNYGWRVMEGAHCTPGVNPKCDTAGYELPIHEYPRKDGISVTGGFVYRGAKISGLCGAYLFADYGSGLVWALRYDSKARRATSHRLILDSGAQVSSFGQDDDYELYLADHGEGILHRLAPKP